MATPLVFNFPGASPGTISVKFSVDVGTKCHRNIAENFNRLSRVHEHFRRQTDGRVTAYIECERLKTIVNSLKPISNYLRASNVHSQGSILQCYQMPAVCRRESRPAVEADCAPSVSRRQHL